MRANELLACLEAVKKTGSGHIARCPAHDDRHASLSVKIDGDTLLLNCFAGCSFESIIAAVPGIKNYGSGLQIVKEYDYVDEQGRLLYQSVRCDPKDFRGRRPDCLGSWIWDLKGVVRVLYHLVLLITSDRAVTVYVCEGEKDCDRLKSLGLVATTNVGGAGRWREEYSDYLVGRNVCIIPDNDEPGRKHAEQVARSLHSKAASVRILELPGLPHKGDVSDFLNAGGTVEDLRGLTEAAPYFQPRAEEQVMKSKTEPRFNLGTLDDLLAEPEEEVSFVLEKTLPRGGFSICSSKPKVGKSTLARNLAVRVSRGLEFLGRNTDKGPVLYLCLEEKRAEVAGHFRRMGASGANIFVHTGGAPDNMFEALEAAIGELQPRLVVIDPLSRFVRVADFNSYGDVTRALEPLIDLARDSACQCHILAIYHNGKGERDGGDALLGSTGFFGAVDALLIMKRRDKTRTLETIQRYGEDLPEIVVNLDPETGVVTAGGDMQSVQLNDRRTAVLDAIGDDVLSEPDIKERITGNQGLTSKAVRSLFGDGQLVRTGAGKKGDPFLYQRAGSVKEPEGLDCGSAEPVQSDEGQTNVVTEIIEDSRFLGFSIYENPQNLEYPEPDSYEIDEVPRSWSSTVVCQKKTLSGMRVSMRKIWRWWFECDED